MKIKNNKFSYVYFTLLLIVILLLIFIPKVTESYENFNKNNKNQKVNLTCDKGQHNDYNCKSFVPENPKTEIITKHVYYPTVTFERGIGPKDSTGKIIFKKKFHKIPSIHCQPIINKSSLNDSDSPPSNNISVFNITLKGFEYKKTLITSKKEYNGLTSLEDDDKNTFNWSAISEPEEKPELPKSKI